MAECLCNPESWVLANGGTSAISKALEADPRCVILYSRRSTNLPQAPACVIVRSLRPLMSGVGSRETGLDSLFASKPVGPGFEPCLGQSAKLAGAPKPLCSGIFADRQRNAMKAPVTAGTRDTECPY